MIKLLDLLVEMDPCWKGYKQIGTKNKNKREVPNCVPINEKNEIIKCEECGWEWNLEDGGEDPYTCHKCGHITSINIEDEHLYEFLYELNKCKNILQEAEYHGRKVTLNKPMQGDVKKFKVYVKNDKGKIVKVNFGAHGMNIKRNNPKRRKAYRARHHCDNPGPKWKANYWSCKKW